MKLMTQRRRFKKVFDNFGQQKLSSKKKMPEKNIPVVINPKLTVWISDESKRESIKLKYADK